MSGSAGVTAPWQVHALEIDVTDADLPEDRFTDHVNNARYFVFINATFQSWYRAMGIRGGVPGQAAVMAHLELDFLREVKPPGRVRCRLSVVRAGRSSLEHAIEIEDLAGAPAEAPALAARGRATHVWIDRAARQARPWPAEVLARCWPAAG